MYEPFPPKSVLKRLTSHELQVVVEFKPSTSNPKADVSSHPTVQEGLRASILDILHSGLDTRGGRSDAKVTVRVTVTVAVDTDNRVTCYLFALTMNVLTVVATGLGPPVEVIVWALDAHGLQTPILVADSVRQTVREGLKDYTTRLAAAKAGPLGVPRGVRCSCGSDSWVGVEGTDKSCESCGEMLLTTIESVQ